MGNQPPAHHSPQQLFDRLARLAIRYHTISHPALFTVAQSKTLRGTLPGGHSKNLFLRNKKGQMWLVTCHEDRRVDLKQLGRTLDAGNLSFASPARLLRTLGVIPGAVTPFALINDSSAAVPFVLDQRLLDYDPLNFHPLDNTMTTAIGNQDFVRFMHAIGHPPRLINFDGGV